MRARARTHVCIRTALCVHVCYKACYYTCYVYIIVVCVTYLDEPKLHCQTSEVFYPSKVDAVQLVAEAALV